MASSTIGKYLRIWSEYAPVTPKTLPTHLSFDEFKSVKEVRGKMSFIYIDADTGKILDILSNRTLSFLKSYFYRFPDDIRNKVETITIDMYAPYIELIKACFPKATNAIGS